MAVKQRPKQTLLAVLAISTLAVLVWGNFLYSVGRTSFWASVVFSTTTTTMTNVSNTTAIVASPAAASDIGGNPQASNSRYPVIDILSIGSQQQPDLQVAQEVTFGSHANVRHFVKVTEADDAETHCHSNLTMGHVQKIVGFCKSSNRAWPFELGRIRMHYARIQWLQRKANPPGWMCAQKRPTDGFAKLMKEYGYQLNSSDGTSSSILPDYLLIGDDDTWFHVDNIVSFIPKAYPPQEAHAVAGCMIRSRVNELNFTIPFGGYGLILTRATLINFLRPLQCGNLDNQNGSYVPSDKDDFATLACWRVSQNAAGERHLFRDGMSVADLMVSYSRHHAYLEVEQWDKPDGSVGFCFHSDWLWGFFVNFYHLARHSVGEPYFANVLQDRLAGYNGSQFYAGRMTKAHWDNMKECYHDVGFHQTKIKPTEQEYCTTEAHVCHRISPNHMQHLYSGNDTNKTDNVSLTSP